MKKIFQPRILSALLGYVVLAMPLATYSYADNAMNKEIACSAADKARGCNECFESSILRYGNTYALFNNVTNKESGALFVDYVDVDVSRGALLYNKTADLTPEYSDWLKQKKYVLNPNDSGRLVTLKDFSIDNIPSEGRKPNNLVIDYIIGSQKIINQKPNGQTYERMTCKPYEISWCGDGVLDKKYGEMCDAKDLKRQGWGLGGCDERTCKPIDKKSGIDWFKKNANPAS